MSKLRALTMPKWGIEMTEGRISEWNVADGDSIRRGQVIALIETDKIVNDLEAEQDGSVARLVAEVGETYPVGALLAVLSTEPASADEVETFIRSFRAAGGSAAANATPAAPMPTHSSEAPAVLASHRSSAPSAAESEIPANVSISPAAHRLALERHVDVISLRGSGRHGRITLQDIDQASKPARTPLAGSPVSITVTTTALDAHYASAYAKRMAMRHSIDLSAVRATGARGRISRMDVLRAAGVREQSTGAKPPVIERFTPMRKAIARQLTTAKTTIPHFYLRMGVTMDSVVALREQLRQGGGSAPSLNDYLLRAVALALAESPGVNIQVHGDEVHRFADADVAVAVATDRGLITPIVRAANTKPVATIAAEVRDLAERARNGRLRVDEYTGGTFSVSNLGMYGIDEFDAIINPPQGAILAVGAARRRAVELNGSLQLATTVHLSLSCDHRAIDGAVGAQFLATLRGLLEQPDRL